jgi:hypothetical protein
MKLKIEPGMKRIFCCIGHFDLFIKVVGGSFESNRLSSVVDNGRCDRSLVDESTRGKNRSKCFLSLVALDWPSSKRCDRARQV